MEPLRIRRGGLEDVDAVARANCAMAAETEGIVLDAVRAREGARALLADPEKGHYLLAERGDASAPRAAPRVVGQLMLTREWSDWRNGWWWWIQSAWVAPDARRTGVYRALHAHVLDEARRRGDVVGVRLYVERENHVAQSTYAAVGMARARYEIFEIDFTK